MQLKLKFLQAVQIRSRRVPKAEWAKHKEDVIREYMSHDLSHVVEWMSKTRNFHASAKQFEHQLKRWNVKKYKKTDHGPGDSKNMTSTPIEAVREKESLESEQFEACSKTPLAPVINSPTEAGNGSPSLKFSYAIVPDSTNKTEMEFQPENTTASPSVTADSVERPIENGKFSTKGLSPDSSTGHEDIEVIEPRLERSIENETPSYDSHFWDPILEAGTLSPNTSNFLRLAQRISGLKRGKPSPDAVPIPNKKSRRASWARQQLGRLPSIDSLSDAMSSLHLGSSLRSRRASEEDYYDRRESASIFLSESTDFAGDVLAVTPRLHGARQSIQRTTSELSSDFELQPRYYNNHGIQFMSVTEMDSIIEMD